MSRDLLALWKLQTAQRLRRDAASARDAFALLQDRTTAYAQAMLGIAELHEQAARLYDEPPAAAGGA